MIKILQWRNWTYACVFPDWIRGFQYSFYGIWLDLAFVPSLAEMKDSLYSESAFRSDPWDESFTTYNFSSEDAVLVDTALVSVTLSIFGE